MRLVSLFTALLFFKIFHWLCESRMAHTETRERDVSPLTHVRLLGLMSTLVAVDYAFVLAALSVYLTQGPNVMIYFGFQFFSLAVTVVAIFMRYLLHLVDMRSEDLWVNKQAYVFYIDMFTDVIKLTL